MSKKNNINLEELLNNKELLESFFKENDNVASLLNQYSLEKINNNISIKSSEKNLSSNNKILEKVDTKKFVLPLEKKKEDLLLQIRNLNFGYKKKEKILNNFNLDLYKGERLAIMGHNGCGKTTLLNILLGYLKNKEGLINLPLYKKTSDFIRTIGVQYQKATYPSNWNIDNAIDFMIDISLTRNETIKYRDWFFNEATKIKEDMLQFFQLEEKRKIKIKKLSGGEQQKLNLILSLIKKPDILVLDEFTTGLDITYKEKTIRYINDYVSKNNITLIIISHIKEEVENLTNRIVIVHDKNIKNDVSVYDLYSDKTTISDYVNEYFVNQRLNDKYKPSYTEVDDSKVTEYYRRGYSLTNPFLNKFKLSSVNVSEDKQPILIENSLKAYNKILFEGWVKSFTWLMPLIFFIISFLIFKLLAVEDPYFGSLDLSKLQYAFSILISSTLLISSTSLIFIWGRKIFQVKSSMNLKRIEVSNSSRNNFINYALLISLVWFFIPLFLTLIVIAILNASDALYNGLVTYNFYILDDINDLLNEQSYVTFDNVTLIYKNSIDLINIDWGLYFGSAILMYMVSLSLVMFIMTVIPEKQSGFWGISITFLFITLGTSTAYIPPSLLIDGVSDLSLVTAFDSKGNSTSEYADQIWELYKQYYSPTLFSQTYADISSIMPLSGPIMLASQSSLNALCINTNVSSDSSILSIVMPIIYTVVLVPISLYSSPKWTETR